MDNPQTIEEKLKVAEAKLKVAEEIIAVVDLFMKACYKAGEWEFKGHKIKVERGDVVTAQSALAQQWGWRTKGGWDAKRVARFLKDLEKEGWIKTKTVFKSHTIISILIYVPVLEPAQAIAPALSQNLPKNESGENPGNTGNSDKKEGDSAKECGVDSSKKVPISNKNNKNIIISNDDVADDENKTEDESSANEKQDKGHLPFSEKSGQVKSSHQKNSKSSIPKSALAPTGGTVLFEYYRSKLLNEYNIHHLKEANDGIAGKKLYEHFGNVEKAEAYIDYAFNNKWIKEKGLKLICFMSPSILNDFEILQKAPQLKTEFKTLDDFDNSLNNRQKQQPKKQITSLDDL